MTPTTLEARAIDLDEPADHAGIGSEPRSPQPVGEHDHRWGARSVLLARKCAADARLHPHHVEERRGDRCRLHALGIVRTGETHLVVAEPCDAVEGAALPGVEEIERIRHSHLVELLEPRGDMSEQDEPLGVGNRQWPQQHRVDDGEDSDAGADAKSDGQDGDPRERRIAQERPEAPPRVTNNRIDPCAEPNVSHLFRHLVNPAELEAGRAASLGRRHPRRAFLLGQHVEVDVKFFPELVLDLIATEETPQEVAASGAQRCDEGHHDLLCGAVRALRIGRSRVPRSTSGSAHWRIPSCSYRNPTKTPATRHNECQHFPIDPFPCWSRSLQIPCASTRDRV